MSSIFNHEYSLINAIEKVHNSLDYPTINHLLNQELFYHAQQELPYHIPNQHTPPTTHQLANKILRQLPTQLDQDQLIQQLMHRLEICKDDHEDQIQQLRAKWAQEKQRIRKSGAKVKDYHKVYSQQMAKGASLDNPTIKKIVSYFQVSTKDRSLEEMLSNLMRLFQPEQQQVISSAKEKQEGQGLNEEVKQLCDQMMEQFKFVESAFNFED